MKWLSETFAPTMNRLFSRPWPSGISSCMQKIIPFILTGSIIYFYNVFRSFIPALPDLSPILNYSFGLISLIVAFMMANQCMEKLNHPQYVINAGIASVCVLLMAVMPVGDSSDSISALLTNLGPTGIAVGMLVGIYVSIVFRLWGKLNFLADSSIPDFVTGWINTIVPNILSLLSAMILIDICHVNVFNVILSLFQPLVSIGQTLPGLVLLMLVQAMLYSMGISSWITGPISTPIFLAGIQGNIDAVAAGLEPMNIVTNEAVMSMGLMGLGGCGATLTLNVLMCFSKSKKLKTMGRIFIGPSIFNINEPIVFGAPIVFNPILMLPMWINAIAGPILIYTVMRLGWLNIPYQLMQIGQIPAPISSVLISEDVRAILWYVVVFIMNMAIWYPFYKIYEKQCIQEEQAAQQKSE